MEKIDINEIYEQAKNDPSLFSTLDIENILEENVKNDYLENKTMTQINTEIFDCMNELGLPKNEIEIFCNKLIGYRHVDKINELHKGKHVRWIRIDNNINNNNNNNNTVKLTAGGIVTNIKFLDNGIHIVCMGAGNRFFQYKFDDCLLFQKLTMEEQLILMAYEHMDNEL